MAFMTNREFAEHEYNRQKRNAYADALVREVRKLRDENEMLKKQLESSQRRERAARNELCQKCGKYKEEHNGACNGCRWKAN